MEPESLFSFASASIAQHIIPEVGRVACAVAGPSDCCEVHQHMQGPQFGGSFSRPGVLGLF